MIVKTILCFALIVCFAILLVNVDQVNAETCDHDSDCNITVCGAGFRVECFERDHSHVCTCIPTSDDRSCDNSRECENKFGDCNHGDHRWHCFGHSCRCGIFG